MQHTTPQAESDALEASDGHAEVGSSRQTDETEQPQVGAVDVTWPRAGASWPVVVVLAFALVVAVALGAWQIVTLHNQVHHLQRVTQLDGRQLTSEGTQLSTLRSSISAAVGCLETPQAPTGLCMHFLR